jgi:hypothetical protein
MDKFANAILIMAILYCIATNPVIFIAGVILGLIIYNRCYNLFDDR